VERIVHENGPLSTWLTRELSGRGGPVVCIDARAAHKALSARMNKSDRADTEALAQLARTGWYREVYIKSEASDRLRLLLGARDRMIRIRQDIEAQARGVLKTYGIRLGPVTQSRNRGSFRDQLKPAAASDPILEAVAASLIAVHDVACGDRRRAPGHCSRQWLGASAHDGSGRRADRGAHLHRRHRRCRSVRQTDGRGFPRHRR
jgi:transposase